MAKFIGRRVNIGLGKEAVRGTGVAPSYSIPKGNLTFDAKANKARSGESLGVISGNGNQAIVTGLFAEGAIEGEINAKCFPLILLATFGASAPTSYSGAYKHTNTLSESNQHQSLSIHQDDPIGDVIFENAMVDSLEITVGMDEIVKFNCGMKAKKAQAGGYTPSYVADYKFVGRDLVFKVAADTASLAAATAVSLKDLKITINKNTDFDWVLGTLEPEDVLNKQITIQGAITLNYEDRTWRDYMLNGDYKAVGIKLTNSRQAVGTTNPELYIELPRVDFSEWESQKGNDDIAGQTINFTALYDITTSKLISDCYVVNDVASY
jgi:hypothetical protein